MKEACPDWQPRSHVGTCVGWRRKYVGAFVGVSVHDVSQSFCRSVV